ncbi:MAG: alpha-galactosidase [Chloroflexota bacterium]|nr:alpha-galactosidase [Chloroflexota bacterium]
MQFSVKDLNLNIDHTTGTVEFQSSAFENAAFLSRNAVRCHSSGKTMNLLSPPWSIGHVDMHQKQSTPHGNLIGSSFEIKTNLPGVNVILRLKLSPDNAMGFIQLEIKNEGATPISIERLTTLDILPGDLHLGDAEIAEPAIYSNGWQSWSTTGAYGLGDKQRSSILGPFQNPMVINPGTPKPKGGNHFTSDMFTVIGDRNSRVGLLAGFLSQKRQFGSLEARFDPAPSLKMWANGDHALVKPGSQVQTDWAVFHFIDLDMPEPLQEYLKAVAQAHDIHIHRKSPLGWCSWYHFYENITQEAIQSNLDSVVSLSSELPLSLLQIDDGFETVAGDWFDFDQGFPKGLQPLVQNIKEAGLTPGLWLAPYIVHPKSALVKDHPDWLLRNKHGRPVYAGFVWNTFTYALDLTNPHALEYTCSVIRTAVEQWGFEYLKLDFLYAAALDGKYQDPTQTRAQVLRKGLNALREAAGPEITMLACGCPLGSALGLFEAMRIGADVSGYWEPHFPPVSPLLRKEPHMPSARNALQNILSRAPLHHHWWINDPDCLLVRPDTDLTLPEVQTLATAIGMTGGSLLLSDNLPALTKERLRLAQVLIPLIEQRAWVLDWFDAQTPSHLRVNLSGPTGDWYLLALFNWDDNPSPLRFTPQAFKLPQEQTWWLHEFWTGAIGQMSETKPFTCSDVPAHGVRVLAARQYQADQPTYLGSDLHLSQGLEISDWRVGDHEVLLRFDLGRQASGKIDLYLPGQPEGAWFHGQPALVHDQGSGIYTLNIEDVDGAELRIKRPV